MTVDKFLCDMILELKDIEESDLNPETTLEKLDLDSLDYVELQVGIKKKFGVSMEPELFLSGKIKTFGDVCSYVDNARSAGLVNSAA